MNNPFSKLMGRSQSQPMQAMPVHHEGNKDFGDLEGAISDIENTLNRLPLGDPTYDDLVNELTALKSKRANIGAAHDQLRARQKGLDVKKKYGDLRTRPGLESLERGVIPGRQ